MVDMQQYKSKSTEELLKICREPNEYLPEVVKEVERLLVARGVDIPRPQPTAQTAPSRPQDSSASNKTSGGDVWRTRGFKAFRLYSSEQKCGTANVLLQSPSPWRSFAGPTSPQFENDSLKLSAHLGPYELPFWMVIGGIQIVGFVCMFFGQPGILIGGLGMAVAEHFFKKFFTKEFTLTIQLSNVAAVCRNGPFVTIIMKEPPAAGLRKVKFFVGESYRETFVKEFNRVFPGMFR